MAKKIKNVDTIPHTWGGVYIEPNTTYTCNDESESLKFSTDDNFIAKASELKAETYNDDVKVESVSNALTFLKGASQTDSDNALFSRLKVVPSGWTYDAVGFDFNLSDIGSFKLLKNNVDDTSINKTYKIYDANDVEISDNANKANAVKTVITVEPTWDFYIVCGKISQTSNRVLLDVMAVPDVPANAGGSKQFVQGINLKKFGVLITDGKAPKFLEYNATYHTNKFKFIFFHEAGNADDISVILELYKL